MNEFVKVANRESPRRFVSPIGGTVQVPFSAIFRTPSAILAAAFSAALVLVTGCGHSSHKATEVEELPPVEASTVEVHAGKEPLFEEVLGTVRPRFEADVSARISGRILTMEAVPGKRVKKGDVLAELEAEELNAALEGAKAALEQAERDLERYRGLVDKGGVSRAEFEKAEAQQRISAATLKEVQSKLDDAVVTAPFDGVITRKFLEAGDLATPGRAIFAMEDPTLLRLEMDVAESIAGDVKLGQALRVVVSGAGAEVEGTVSEIAPSADPSSRTFLVKLDLPAHEHLRAGQFGRAFLPRGERMSIRVPESAVLQRGQMDYVFVAEGGLAHLRIVRTGRSDGGQVEILAGLEEGETVVAEPPAELLDGQPLKG